MRPRWKRKSWLGGADPTYVPTSRIKHGKGRKGVRHQEPEPYVCRLHRDGRPSSGPHSRAQVERPERGRCSEVASRRRKKPRGLRVGDFCAFKCEFFKNMGNRLIPFNTVPTYLQRGILTSSLIRGTFIVLGRYEETYSSEYSYDTYSAPPTLRYIRILKDGTTFLVREDFENRIRVIQKIETARKCESFLFQTST